LPIFKDNREEVMNIVHSKDKKKTKVEFLEIAQDLLTSINDWVKSQQYANTDVVLLDWLKLASGGYINASRGNNTKITSIESYCKRNIYLRDSNTDFKTMQDYLDVVLASHKIKQSRIIKWCAQIEEVIKQIHKIRKYDYSRIKKLCSSMEEKELRERIKEYVEHYNKNL
jgi:uncharacterized protein YjhX (UPF0386 family)